MDDQSRKKATREKIREEIGADSITSAHIIKYPLNAERQYQNLVKKVLRSVRKALLAQIGQLETIVDSHTEMEELSQKQTKKKRRRQRVKTLDKALDEIQDLFFNIELYSSLYSQTIDTSYEVKKIFMSISDLNQSEWEKAVEETIGEKVPPKAYYDRMHESEKEKWVDENKEWLDGICKETVDEIKADVLSAYVNGEDTKTVIDSAKAGYDSAKKRNTALVINRVSNINTEITKQKYQDAGLSHYKWWTRQDEKVRPSHERLHGKIFSWDDPPETDGGRHCHPGEDYGCRCTALPVFDLDMLEI